MVYRFDEIDSFDEWRHLALQTIHVGISPENLVWPTIPTSEPLLSLEEPSDHVTFNEVPKNTPEAQVRMSSAFRVLLREASFCRIPERWGVLYAALWRWTRGDRAVASAADDIGGRLHRMAKAVRRDHHDFIAYLRFRKQEVPPPAPRFVAWYEPDHDTLEAAADHFADRMGRETFLIATPLGTAFWDGEKLAIDRGEKARQLKPPVEADPHNNDSLDASHSALWLTYYRSIFNPARLNETALVQRLPVRRWGNLPEARLISELITDARAGAQRVGQAGAVGEREGHVIAAGLSGSCVSARARTADFHASPLQTIEHTLDKCRNCALWQHATAAVPGEGPARATLMIVGEQPGDQEDIAGRVFVGPAGKVLNQALERAGVKRDDVYLTNAVKHFKWTPRGKRRLHKTPQQHEMLACREWLEEELQNVSPKVVVTLGATALSSVISPRMQLGKSLNQTLSHEGRWVIPTYHPAYALRQPDPAMQDKAMDTIVQALTRARELIG